MGPSSTKSTFVSAEQQDGSVQVTLERNGETSKFTASFVVGCDGAHSTVRHVSNLPFEGAVYEGLLMLADVQTNETLPADQMQLCPSELGPVAIFPMSATRRRIVASIEHAQGDAPSLDLVQKILREHGPDHIAAISQHWSSYFRIFCRVRSTAHPEIMLVRPDGYVAFAAASREGRAALASLRKVLERQTGQAASASLS